MDAHVMLDLETMGIGNKAAIIAIGAAKFDLKGCGPTDCFYTRVDLETSLRYGMEVSAGTIDWWMSDDQADARKALLQKDSVAQDLADALWGFSQWFGQQSLPIWGNGAAFDNVILRNAYDLLRATPPWAYRDDRCYRTLRALCPDATLPEMTGTAHHALDDAVHQVYCAQALYAHLRSTN